MTVEVGLDDWVERSRWVGRREERWLERTIDAATGHVECVYGYAADELRARVATRATATTVTERSGDRRGAFLSGHDVEDLKLPSVHLSKVSRPSRSARHSEPRRPRCHP